MNLSGKIIFENFVYIAQISRLISNYNVNYAFFHKPSLYLKNKYV